MNKKKALADRLDFSGQILHFKSSETGGVSLIFLFIGEISLLRLIPAL